MTVPTLVHGVPKRRVLYSRQVSKDRGTPEDSSKHDAAAAQRKAAWAKVMGDVFPLLSKPQRLIRPFKNWKG